MDSKVSLTGRTGKATPFFKVSGLPALSLDKAERFTNAAIRPWFNLFSELL